MKDENKSSGIGLNEVVVSGFSPTALGRNPTYNNLLLVHEDVHQPQLLFRVGAVLHTPSHAIIPRRGVLHTPSHAIPRRGVLHTPSHASNHNKANGVGFLPATVRLRRRTRPTIILNKVVDMKKHLRNLMVIALAAIMTVAASADQKHGISRVDNLEIDVWVNKSDGATYYFGEDVAVYFRASEDCYAVIYDIDPAGNVSLLFPSDYNSDCFIRGEEVYRIPDAYDDYRLEVTGPKGKEYIYAVASPYRIDPPEFMRYEYFEYGNWDSYYDDFVHTMRGEMAVFVNDLNNRIVRNGSYISASTMFFIDNRYRHHSWYRYWRYDPYYIGSIWIGCDYPGAEIWIDGCYFGIAPILIPEIYIGRHWVWIYYHGYPCWQDYVYVTRGQRYYVDAKIKRKFRDFDYGRSNMKNWRFKQEKHRNDPGFVREAEKYRVKHTRPLHTPPSRVQKKYSDRIFNDGTYTEKINKQNSGLIFKEKNKKDNIHNYPQKDREYQIKREKSSKSLNSDDKDIIINKKQKQKKPNSGQTSVKKTDNKKSDNIKKNESKKAEPVRSKTSDKLKSGSSKSGSKYSKERGRK